MVRVGRFGPNKYSSTPAGLWLKRVSPRCPYRISAILSPAFDIQVYRIQANYISPIFLCTACFFFIRWRSQSRPSPLHYLWSSTLLTRGGQKAFQSLRNQRKTYPIQAILILPRLMGSRSGHERHHPVLCYCIGRSGPRLLCWRRDAGSLRG